MMSLLDSVTRLFDWLEDRWEGPGGRWAVGLALILCYLGAILVIELNRLGLIPLPLSQFLPTNHFLSIELAFNLLLLSEILSLVFSLAHSVAISAGKQFEVLSLILVRDTFKEFSGFQEPLIWAEVVQSLDEIMVTAIAALLIYVILGFYYRTQQHQPITQDENNLAMFIATKKLLALALLLGLAVLALRDVYFLVVDLNTEVSVFEEFYTMLVFSDVLIVLISLLFSSNYHVAFRNSGFTVSTVLIRLSLIAPVVIGAMLGVAGALFTLGMSLAYGKFIQLSATKLKIPQVSWPSGRK
ncbi:MAG: hypothetical protein KDF65_02615 [Anaerolineae bacterium]|nr:hypothetical protein [Anaerolineae bacterium]